MAFAPLTSLPFFSFQDGVLPAEAPKLFGAMPEFYLESCLDFIAFLLKYVYF